MKQEKFKSIKVTIDIYEQLKKLQQDLEISMSDVINLLLSRVIVSPKEILSAIGTAIRETLSCHVVNVSEEKIKYAIESTNDFDILHDEDAYIIILGHNYKVFKPNGQSATLCGTRIRLQKKDVYIVSKKFLENRVLVFAKEDSVPKIVAFSKKFLKTDTLKKETNNNHDSQ
ncbi:MAG: hypothetical protein Q6363_006360 [Candidatus Njordarchaeota archaeon]